jgi:hypothetical protein
VYSARRRLPVPRSARSTAPAPRRGAL